MGLTSRYIEKVTIMKLFQSGTSYGGTIEVWQDWKSVYMDKMNQKGNTTFNDGNIYHDNVSFRSRFIPFDGTKGYRLRHNNQSYEILNYTVIRSNGTKDLIIDCKAVS